MRVVSRASTAMSVVVAMAARAGGCGCSALAAAVSPAGPGPSGRHLGPPSTLAAHRRTPPAPAARPSGPPVPAQHLRVRLEAQPGPLGDDDASAGEELEGRRPRVGP